MNARRDLQPYLSGAAQREPLGATSSDDLPSALDSLVQRWFESGGSELGELPPRTAHPLGRIDGYEVLEELARGGMGLVLRAKELGSGREVALKLILDVAASQRAIERFRREGEIAAALSHPGIVRVHAAGTFAGLPYLAIELVPGACTLDRIVRGMDQRRRVELIRDAARGLGHAHARGVVHRDVKPANLLVDEQGRLRVSDFGLALDPERARLTASGHALGTAPYMAPEQLAGERERLSPATDVWALGVVLYETTCGRHPFQVGSHFGGEVLTRIAAGWYPRPRVVAPRLCPRLEAVIERCLVHEPGDRYPNGDALADELERWLAGERVLATTRWRPAGKAVAAVAGALSLLFGSALFALRPSDPLPSTSTSARMSGNAQPAAAEADPRPTAARRGRESEPVGSTTTHELLRAGARAGDPAMMFGLATILWTGEGCPQDRDAAAEWMRRAAEAGHKDAMYRLGRMYRQGKGQERDPARAAAWFERALALEHAGAAAELAGMLLLAEGVPRDVDRAWRLALAGARGGFSEGVEALEQLRARGEGSPAARAEGEAWLLRAEVARLLPEAGEAGGSLTTPGVLRNEVEAGNPVAIYALAQLLHSGEGLKKDRVAAVRWMRLAAEAGHRDAQYQLGQFHRLGHGVAVDLAASAGWYEKARAAGHLRAGAELAKLLLHGQGVAKDVDRAWTLALDAAKDGLQDGYEALTELRQVGQGSPALQAEADGFLRAGAARGDPWARTALERHASPEPLPRTPPELERKWWEEE